jgi:hypothetical protein
VGVCITPPNAQGQQFSTALTPAAGLQGRSRGHLLGWFGTIGKRVGQFYWVLEMRQRERDLHRRAQTGIARHDEMAPRAATNSMIRYIG